MAVYILNFFIVTICGLIGQNNKNNKSKKYKVAIIIATLSLVLVSGLRYRVGTDYMTYSDVYTYLVNDKLNLSGPIGYNILLFIIHKISANSQMMFLVTSIIINIGFMIFVIKYSNNIFLSLYFYITFFTYYITMNTIRQYIAAVVLCLGLKEIYNGRFSRYIIYIIIASLFHPSALIMFIVYFVVKRKLNSKVIILILFNSTLALVFYKYFLKILFYILKGTDFYRYKDIMLESNGANPIRLIAWILPILIIYLYKNRAIKLYGNDINIITNLCLMGAIFMCFATKHVFFARMSVYFDFYYMILMPLICKMFDDKTNRVITLLMMFFYLVYSFALLIIGEAWIYPYNYNLNLF